MIRNKRNALISVYYKDNLLELCNIFKKYSIDIISTGSTASHITSLGFKCKNVASITNFKEILDGRVKTLHPKIYASLLFNRKNDLHAKTFRKLKFPLIDFVIVNLYPFEKTILKNKNINQCVEMIDVGGPSLLRASAKNYEYLTTICDINDYKLLITNLEKNHGTTSKFFRKKMAQKTFYMISNYDSVISNWLNKNNETKLITDNHTEEKLKYGENPHQKSFFYKDNRKKTIFDNILHGKKISYNNVLDIDSAINFLNDFDEATCVIIKHNNPCSAASSYTIHSAFIKAHAADPKSAFGGIVGLNRTVNEKIAKNLSKYFFEIVIAKNFSKKALTILTRNKKLILIKNNNINKNIKKELRSINGGYLQQDMNLVKFSNKDIKCVSQKKANKKQIEDLIFAFKVCKYVKSNAIVLAKNKKTTGIGAGQMNRLEATKLALIKASKKDKLGGFVAASDAFFPFTDNIKLLIKNNCKSIIQAKGSINDSKIINYANKYNFPLYFSKYRFFRH